MSNPTTLPPARRALASQLSTPRIVRVLGGDARIASNDEGAPMRRYAGSMVAALSAVPHVLERDRDGYGLDGKVRVRCTCGFAGPWRNEDDDSCYAKLGNDERLHRAGGVL